MFVVGAMAVVSLLKTWPFIVLSTNRQTDYGFMIVIDQDSFQNFPVCFAHFKISQFLFLFFFCIFVYPFCDFCVPANILLPIQPLELDERKQMLIRFKLGSDRNYSMLFVY